MLGRGYVPPLHIRFLFDPDIHTLQFQLFRH